MIDSVCANNSVEECKQLLRDNITLDPGFKAFYAWCKSNDIPVIIVSRRVILLQSFAQLADIIYSGMTPTIRAVLTNLFDEEANNIEIIANDIQELPGGKWTIQYRHPTRYVPTPPLYF